MDNNILRAQDRWITWNLKLLIRVHLDRHVCACAFYCVSLISVQLFLAHSRLCSWSETGVSHMSINLGLREEAISWTNVFKYVTKNDLRFTICSVVCLSPVISLLCVCVVMFRWSSLSMRSFRQWESTFTPVSPPFPVFSYHTLAWRWQQALHSGDSCVVLDFIHVLLLTLNTLPRDGHKFQSIWYCQQRFNLKAQ